MGWPEPEEEPESKILPEADSIKGMTLSTASLLGPEPQQQENKQPAEENSDSTEALSALSLANPQIVVRRRQNLNLSFSPDVISARDLIGYVRACRNGKPITLDHEGLLEAELLSMTITPNKIELELSHD